MNDIKELLRWIDMDTLNDLCESFSQMTGLSTCTIDINGNELTKRTYPNAFADYLIENSPLARRLRHANAMYGANETIALSEASIYYSYSGLLQFSAPIIIDGVFVAYILGGLVAESDFSKTRVSEIAAYFDVDADKLFELSRNVPVYSFSKLKHSANFAYNTAKIISNTATSRLKMNEARIESENASQMKNAFLANMSHEIRTPMNAVIGMAEIALREEMAPAAREYVNQIQTSGKALVHIINDILDFSKISSGKLDIFEEEYNIVTLTRDVSNIIMNRLKDKEDEVSLIVNLDPMLPKKLIGDGPRIQQILINLANNAVKFTKNGQVTINIGYVKKDDSSIILTGEIKDTGIGIKAEDLNKLFVSFAQVDSKRNRNVEGTGLGLAICQQLLNLMGGEIHVESKYGIGSIFSFNVPQKVADSSPAVVVNDSSKKAVRYLIANNDIASHFQHVMDQLGIAAFPVTPDHVSHSALEQWIDENSHKECYFVIEDESAASGILSEFNMPESKASHLHTILLISPFRNEALFQDIAYLHILHKPLYTANICELISPAVNIDEAPLESTREVKFTTHDARVLIVDDTPINLRVAESLLKTTGVASDKAISGQQALDKLVNTSKETNHYYDIIFMDHMMPGIDGIDTTRLIRRFHPKFNSVPIIALTANASEEARKMFLDEGMSDFIAKPIEIKRLNELLLRWLPPEKIEIIKD